MDANVFFGWHIPMHTLWAKSLALMLAILLGGLVGLERELRGHPAGLRTHILVCVGSTLITLVSAEIGLDGKGGLRGDPGRLAAQIVTGIGFLGAGAIVREGVTIHGLTTAASIWTMAGIGIAVGCNPRQGELAVVTTVVALGTLTVLNRIEDSFGWHRRIRSIEVEVRSYQEGRERVLELVKEAKLQVQEVEREGGKLDAEGAGTYWVRLQVKVPRKFKMETLAQQLVETPDVVAFRLN